ncbi:MAG: hypothetical protein GC154_16090 [bacterium]|nr:hypothetical protein [bacterium]
MNSIRRILIVSIVSLTLAAGAARLGYCQAESVVSASPTITTTADRQDILIGDVIHLTVTVTHDPAIEVMQPGQSIDLNEFVLLGVEPGGESKTQNGLIATAFNLSLSIYKTGDFKIPEFPVAYSLDGERGELLTEAVEIHVGSLLPTPAAAGIPGATTGVAIQEIKQPLTPRGVFLWWVLGLGALILLIVAILAWLAYRVMNKKPVLPPAPPVPAHERALQALAALRRDKRLFEERRLEEFTVKVTEILRGYLQERYGFAALQYTTDEIVHALKRIQLPYERIADFKDFSQECDLIKFARHEVETTEMTRLIDIAEAFVKITRPVEEAAPAPEPAGDARPKLNSSGTDTKD